MCYLLVRRTRPANSTPILIKVCTSSFSTSNNFRVSKFEPYDAKRLKRAGVCHIYLSRMQRLTPYRSTKHGPGGESIGMNLWAPWNRL
jgi:hypothetical protein